MKMCNGEKEDNAPLEWLLAYSGSVKPHTLPDTLPANTDKKSPNISETY
jgi:hypothetical protein